MNGAVPSRLAGVGLGSNLGQPERQIEAAMGLLCDLPRCRVIAQSSLYRSAPFGPIEQPDFVNAVATLETELAARELLRGLQGIEDAMGRSRDGERWGPRVIDLDLLLLGDEEIDEDGLTVPHPGIGERNFVLLPLMEIAPHLVIPGLGPLADIAVDKNGPWIQRIA